MEKYILNYLRENSEDALVSKYIYLLKNDLDTLLYGNDPSFKGRKFHIPSKYELWKSDSKLKIKNLIKLHTNPLGDIKSNKNLKNVLSTMYFGSEDDFLKYGFRITSTVLRPLSNIIDAKPFKEVRNLYHSILRSGSFKEMLRKEKLLRLESLKDDIAEVLIQNDIKAFFTHNDEEFCNKYLIDICKEARIPSFEFLHGLPGVYSQAINSSTDYFCVWGKKIKENYLNIGFDSNRIFVTGAPRFSNFNKKIEHLRNSFEDVLVATSTACIWIQHGWVMDEFGDQNDSLFILYIYMVEHVLKKLGVKHARLRPHQTVEKKWVAKYIDTSFYSFDYESVNDSLSHTSMVIGPHSTFLLDAMLNGVNYYVFDPTDNGSTLRGEKIVPPFDGRNDFIHLARTEKELMDNIKNRVTNDLRFLDGYLHPFDLSPLIGLI